MVIQSINIIELQDHEGDLCKELRLRALKDSPESFGESFSEANGRSQEYWQKMTKSLTPPGKNRMFIAIDQDAHYGSAFFLLDKDDEKAARVGGMWVDSAFRRKGIGQALLSRIFTWARTNQFEKLKLWVEATPTEVKLFYQKSGFIETENRDTSHSKIDKDIVEMVCKL